MRPRQTVLLVLGIVAVAATLGLLAIGAPLLWAHGTQRDDAGYYTLQSERLATPTYAVSSERIEVFADVHGGRWDRVVDQLGTVRISVDDLTGKNVFVGIARTSDVTAYLGTASYDVVSDLSGGQPLYQRHDGAGAPAGTPAEQPFWVASADGAGRQTMTWDVRRGDWTLVVMNADATPGIDVAARAGVRTDALGPVGAGFLGAAAVTGLVAALLLAGAVVGLTHDPGPASGSGPAPGSSPVAASGAPTGLGRSRTAAPTYPVRVDARLEEPLNRWLWLVKWILVIPHLIVLAFLWLAFGALTVVAGISILLTGRYPHGVFAFNVGVLRWHWRVAYYALTLGTDRYPPFTLGAAPDYPATLSIPYPEQLSRPLVLVKWWLLALPHYLVIALFGGTSWWAVNGDDRLAYNLGLVGILALVAGVTLAVTRRYPTAVFDFILGMQRWTLRVAAYAALMRDEYPPFRLDLGGTDPGDRPSPPPPAPAPAAGDDELARI
ncbi:DUF4389 domain-containing protein [Cryptosporangium minutisporangium]|uniref:DUF4389 domain-containing protein n=1 Tax=Cryptosporangium minutisporangium TaxID=113569 RepID=A0ABP6T8M4_9ACTN